MSFSNNPVFIALKREKAKFIACALLIITGVTGSTLSPLFQKDLVDLLKNGAGSGTFRAALLCAVALGLWRFSDQCRAYIEQRLCLSLEKRLKQNIFHHIYDLPPEFLRIGGSTYYVSRFNIDADQFNRFCAFTLVNFPMAACRSAAGLVMAFSIDSRFGVILFPCMLCYTFFTLLSGRKQYEFSLEISELNAKYRQLANSSFSHIVLLKSSDAGEAAKSKCEDILKRLVKLKGKRLACDTFYRGLMQVVPPAAASILFVYGVWQMRAGFWQLGTFWAALGTLYVALSPVRQMCFSWIQYQQAKAALTRLKEVFAIAPERADGLAVEEFKGDFKFKNISFSYPGSDRKVLTEMSLDIPPESIVAVTGKSGCGKSTIIKLIMRLYEPTGGEITLGGIPIEKLELHSFRHKIGYVGQDPELLPGKLRDNLDPLQKFSDEKLLEVLDNAGFPDGAARLSQVIPEDGSGLSGGEKLRLVFARELLKEPELFLLDEITANLDCATAKNISAALPRLLNGKRALLISHDKEALAVANSVYTLENGRII